MSSRPRLKCLKPRLAPSTTTTTSTTGWQPDSHRGNRHQRGYGWEWQQTRERILHRDNGLCQPHLQQGETAVGNQVDHIVSKAEARSLGWSKARTEDDTNLQTICEACHRAKTSSESLRAMGGGCGR